MVEKLPKFVIDAIFRTLEQKLPRSPSDAAGNSAQKVASRTHAGGDPQASDKKPTTTKVGGVTIKPKYFVEVFAGKAGLSRAVANSAVLRFTPSKSMIKTDVTFAAKPLRND